MIGSWVREYKDSWSDALGSLSELGNHGCGVRYRNDVRVSRMGPGMNVATRWRRKEARALRHRLALSSGVYYVSFLVAGDAGRSIRFDGQHAHYTKSRCSSDYFAADYRKRSILALR
jgi:hypothetical protein